jgi:hypothetical protein
MNIDDVNLDDLVPNYPDAHVPVQIGTRDEEGHRTFDVPGDVCEGCSDPDAGRWVPVNQCPIAWPRFKAENPWGAPFDD